MTANAYGFQKNRVVAVSAEHAEALIASGVAVTPEVRGPVNDEEPDGPT